MAPKKISEIKNKPEPSGGTKMEFDVEENKRLGEPIAHLRDMIAYKWRIIVRLTKKLKIHPKKKHKESEESASERSYRKIKNGRASIATIREEIANILAQKIPMRRKGVHLELLLGQCVMDVEEILTKRNELRAKNENLAHGFINLNDHQRLVNKVKERWGEDEPEQLAQVGLLRSCETWDPKVSQLSTWAYTCIASLFKNAVKMKKGEKNPLSLDRKSGTDRTEGLSFAETCRDTKVEADSSRRESQSEDLARLKQAFDELEPVLRRILELTMGLGGNEVHKNPAQKLNEENYRTKSGGQFNSHKVNEYKKMALNALKKRLKKNEPEKGVNE